ncbi:MAG: hypothetical protein KJP16_07770 [Gammaproteobacteria bacterium]|nr:hypothetical protein [Gammaproteobacteria bacterium]NNL50701.1 hypothetical protein [Woeseiaceae bacterium]
MATTALLNYVVDPYLAFGSPRINRFNAVKTEINDYVRTAKAFEPFRYETDVLLAGNSRIEMGLDPDHACFTKLGLHAYNLGIPGAGVGQQLNYVLNVLYVQPVKRVFLSVDFVDFLVSEGAAPPPKDSVVTTGNLPRRFDGSDNPDYAWTIAKTRFQALLSLNALTSSVQTVFLQGAAYRPDRLANGLNPAKDFVYVTSLEGPGALFELKMASLRERLASPLSLHYSDNTLAGDFDLFARFLDIAAVQGVEVIVLTNPFHEWFWDLLRMQGLFDAHADWLEEIESRVRSAPGRVTLWDFSADSEFIRESVPLPGVKAPPLEWFWEPSHYRKSLGDKMLDSMLAKDCGSQASFGRQFLIQN